MQKGDLSGLVIVLALGTGIIGFLALAPKAAEEIVYAPVELAGSALRIIPSEAEREVQVEVEVVQPGFVTVHQGIGDAPGPIVGVSNLLAIGSHAEVTIQLTEPMFAGQDYFVLLFVDDGDAVYESRVDLPVMVDGAVVKGKISL